MNINTYLQQTNLEPFSVVHLWYEAGVGSSDVIPNAALPARPLQHPLQRLEPPLYEVPAPRQLVHALLVRFLQHGQVLDGLDAAVDDLAYLQ